MKEIIEGLKMYLPVKEVKLPQSTGFYAFYVLNDYCFRGTELSNIRQYDCIYVGIAADETLYKRVVESHLKAAGKSTFRRSLGAILRDRLELKPIMRGLTSTRSNVSNYTFSKVDEERLTGFMFENLAIAYYPYDYSSRRFEDIEKEIIKEFGYPAFNIEYSKQTDNHYLKSVKQARKECRSIVASQVRS